MVWAVDGVVFWAGLAESESTETEVAETGWMMVRWKRGGIVARSWLLGGRILRAGLRGVRVQCACLVER